MMATNPEILAEPRMSQPAKDCRWGFVGCGKMATALVRGMVRAGVARPASIAASDPSAAARDSLAAAAGVAVFEENSPVVRQSDALVLAVKPQVMNQVMEELRPLLQPEQLVISIAAGIPLAALAAGLGTDRRLVRVMPNTPALLGEGASAYALGAGVRAEDEAVVRALLDAVGRSVRVPESMLDAVTGLSGSGPAFVYLMIEALSDGGVRVGLPREIATMLAAQTVLGAARMVLETGLHPGALKDQVASPGGTTIAGLHALERCGVRGALIDAVQAATSRSAELAGLPSPPAPRPPGPQPGSAGA
jgi:pyrroline-5-carboxylate reductase